MMKHKNTCIFIGTNAEATLMPRQYFLAQLAKETHLTLWVSNISNHHYIIADSLNITLLKSPLSRAGLNPFADAKACWQMAQYLRKNTFDIAYILYAKPLVFGTIACAIAKVKKRIAMMAGLGFAFTKRPKRASIKTTMISYSVIALYYISLPLLHRVIFLNNDDANTITTHYHIPIKHHVTLGGIGVDIDYYQYHIAPTSPIIFTFIGRLLYDKGIKEFIEAANIIKQSYPNDPIEFMIYGDIDEGNPESMHLHEFNKLNHHQAVILAGFSNDIRQALIDSSVFVLPSYREGVPRSTQEAMATGRAIITSDAPGCNDTVIHGDNGFISPVFNSTILAQHMAFFIKNPQDIINMGEKSRLMAERHYNQIKVTKRLISHIIT